MVLSLGWDPRLSVWRKETEQQRVLITGLSDQMPYDWRLQACSAAMLYLYTGSQNKPFLPYFGLKLLLVAFISLFCQEQ